MNNSKKTVPIPLLLSSLFLILIVGILYIHQVVSEINNQPTTNYNSNLINISTEGSGMELSLDNMGSAGIALWVYGVPEGTARLQISRATSPSGPWISFIDATYNDTFEEEQLADLTDGSKSDLYYKMEAFDQNQNLIAKTKNIRVPRFYEDDPEVAPPSSPDGYESIILEEGKPNYVKAGGSVKVLFSQSATISVGIAYVYSPNVKFNPDNNLSSINYFNHTTVPKDPSNVFVYGDYGDYSFTFAAPKIPGKYAVGIDGLESAHITDVPSSYNITVIDKVDNELMASKIVDRTIFDGSSEEHIRNWRINSQKILSLDKSWDVNMQIYYDYCGIDWDSGKCTTTEMTGHYLIDKNTGILSEKMDIL